MLGFRELLERMGLMERQANVPRDECQGLKVVTAAETVLDFVGSHTTLIC